MPAVAAPPAASRKMSYYERKEYEKVTSQMEKLNAEKETLDAKVWGLFGDCGVQRWLWRCGVGCARMPSYRVHYGYVLKEVSPLLLLLGYSEGIENLDAR